MDDFRDFGLGFLLYITGDIVDAQTVVRKLVLSMIQFLTLSVWCYSDNDWDTLSYVSVMWFES